MPPPRTKGWQQQGQQAGGAAEDIRGQHQSPSPPTDSLTPHNSSHGNSPCSPQQSCVSKSGQNHPEGRLLPVLELQTHAIHFLLDIPSDTKEHLQLQTPTTQLWTSPPPSSSFPSSSSSGPGVLLSEALPPLSTPAPQQILLALSLKQPAQLCAPPT